jgi:hypothetical protein
VRSNDSVLKLYERETEVVLGPGELLFRIAALCSFLLFGAFGLYLKTHNPPPQVMEEKAERLRQVSFVMEEKKKPASPAPVKKIEPIVKKEPEPKKEEPIDLTKNPVLNQKIDDLKPEPPPTPAAEPVRRVYGLRKVYATGLGAGGDGSEAIIGKQGNTLNADIDTATATEKELKGAVAPITQIARAPKIKKIVKPEYSDEMREAGIQGTIWAELVIDSAGVVREAKILNDLGFGSKELARRAFLQCIFEPALLSNGKPTATRIKVPMKFVLLEE